MGGALRIVKPPPTAYGDDYWGMHVAAVLLCLDDHQGLAGSKLGPGWSLAEYRETEGPLAFARIGGQVQNWGAQYLIADLLNRDTIRLRTPLLKALEESHETQLGKHVLSSVSGRDSVMGWSLLSSTRARILGDRRRRVARSREEVAFTDLCILVTDPRNRGGHIAIFGEVEGNYGELLLRSAYWIGKARYSRFGIGLVHDRLQRSDRTSRKDSQWRAATDHASWVTLQVREEDGRVIVALPERGSVFADFQLTVQWMEKLFAYGPSKRWWHPELDGPPGLLLGLSKIFDVLAHDWRKPVQRVLEDLGYKTGLKGKLVGVVETIVPFIGRHAQRVTLPEPQLLVSGGVRVEGSTRRSSRGHPGASDWARFSAP